MATCACGCGAELHPDSHGRIPKWRKGHHSRGKKRAPEEIAKRKQTRLARNDGRYQTAKGWKHSEETRQRMSAAKKGRPSPLRGHKYSGTALANIRAAAAKRTGENSPSWNGGASTLPYGPEFTRKYKRLLRDRDGHRCRRCGKTREEEGRTLEIHHLDHDKMNNDPTNLVTSCHSCNVWASYHRSESFLPES